MPTGYTDKIKDGISFNEFIMNCARAFGALVTMRDSMGVPIPEKFEPSDYYEKELKKAREELDRLDKMNLKESEIEAEKEYQENRRYVEKAIKNSNELEKKYNDMLLMVNKWIPPSLDHNGLKKFMIEQIERSIKFDCGTEYFKENPPKLSTPKDWLHDKKLKSMESISYYYKENEKEIKRTNERNLWLKQLRDSLTT